MLMFGSSCRGKRGNIFDMVSIVKWLLRIFERLPEANRQVLRELLRKALFCHRLSTVCCLLIRLVVF